VGRSLYSPEKGIQVPPKAAARPYEPVRALSVDSREGSGTATDDAILAAKAAMLFAENVGGETCSHGELWTLKPAGISKVSGKPYEAFWAASHKAPDGSYCREKPSAKFLNAKKPAAPKLVPEDNLEELPF
jgi:hypothetical protein